MVDPPLPANDFLVEVVSINADDVCLIRHVPEGSNARDAHLNVMNM